MLLCIEHPTSTIKMPLQLVVLQSDSFDLMVGLHTMKMYGIDVEGSKSRVAIRGQHASPIYFHCYSQQEHAKIGAKAGVRTIHAMRFGDAEELAKGVAWQRSGKDEPQGKSVDQFFRLSPRQQLL